MTSAEENSREENKGDGELGKGGRSGRIKRAGPVGPHPEKDTVPRHSPFLFPRSRILYILLVTSASQATCEFFKMKHCFSNYITLQAPYTAVDKRSVFYTWLM